MVSDVFPPPDGFPPPPPPPAPLTRVDPSAQPTYFAVQYPSEPTTNVLAIVGFAVSFFVGLVGIICGHIALAQIEHTGEKGRGLALAAAIIGYVQVGLVVLWVAFVFVVVVVTGVTASLTTSSPATQGASPSADCTKVEDASLTLSSALTSIADSSWKDDPAAAKDAVNAASNRFNDQTQYVSDVTLSGEINTEQMDLTLLGSAFVDYEAAAPGQGGPVKVTVALTTTSDDLTTLSSTCQ